jgi:pimeloyl-ACP methyl ester carboxylesterase
VPTPEGETFVLSCGPADADSLVLLHGSGANSTQWMSRVADLATRFRVYAIDIIGEPGLSAPARPPLDSDRYAGWLDAVLDSLGLDQVLLVARNYRYRSGDLPVFDDAALRRLTMPVHVLADELDVMLDPRETKRRLEAVAPHATVRLLPGVGHFVPPRPAVEHTFLTS